MALSLYALSGEQPTPTNDELLFCTANTSAEEIENFLRLVVVAASSNVGHRSLFCVLNIQELGYEAQTAVERFIHTDERLVMVDASSAALVFVGTSSKPSLIASVLAKYRVHPILLDDDVLRLYVKEKLVLPHDVASADCGEQLDPDRMGVRVLTSQRSGNGKSKYVKYLMKKKRSLVVDYKVVRVKSQTVDLDAEIEKLIDYRRNKTSSSRAQITLFHIDIAYEVGR